jgi:hypothetical protein
MSINWGKEVNALLDTDSYTKSTQDFIDACNTSSGPSVLDSNFCWMRLCLARIEHHDEWLPRGKIDFRKHCADMMKDSYALLQDVPDTHGHKALIDEYKNQCLWLLGWNADPPLNKTQFDTLVQHINKAEEDKKT